MAAQRKKKVAKPSSRESRRESGAPGGGEGRIDIVGRSGVYPASGPYPSGPAELRLTTEFVHGQTDAEGRPVEGGSEPIFFQGQTLLGGVTPTSSGPPTPAAAPQAHAPKTKRRHTEPAGKSSKAKKEQPQ